MEEGVMKKTLSVLVTIAFVACFASLSAQDLVILHTNDTHSHIDVVKGGRNDGLGGVERREQYIDSIRKAYPGKVLLVDSGDFSQGSPYFTLFKGDAEDAFVDALGYDAATFGNHEFDNGCAELARRIRHLKCPIVNCNYLISEENPLHGLIPPYTIVERGGRKIGILGITLNLPGLVNPKTLAGMKYQYPSNCINRYALELKNKHKCDLIIVLSHCGYDEGKQNNPGDMQIAPLTENVDIIIGGHSHTFLNEPSIVKNKLGRDVVIVQDGCWGVEVGRIDLWF